MNSAVFPGLQGGPHLHQIAAIAVSLKEAATPEFKDYQRSIVANMQALANYLLKAGIRLVSGGTDNHLALLDLREEPIDGARLEWVLDRANIAANKNAIPGDTSARTPQGLRIGTPALPTRGLRAPDFEQVGRFIVDGLLIARWIGRKTGPKFGAFKQLAQDDATVAELRKKVIEFANQFPLPGVFDPAKYY